MSSPPRRFTYAEARALVPEVRRLTASAHAAVDALQARLGGPDDAEIQQHIEREVQGWAQALSALGIEIKGLWLADFDSGAGYYCWRWPEPDLQYYHSYEEGFGGRVRVH